MNHPVFFFTYDYTTDQLNLRWVDRAQSDNVALSHFCTQLVPDIAYSWSFRSKGIAVHNTTTGVETLRPYPLDIREPYGRKKPRTQHEAMRSGDRYITRYHLPDFHNFDNCEVFAIAGDNGAQLWFFNPDFVPGVPFAESFLAIEESG